MTERDEVVKAVAASLAKVRWERRNPRGPAWPDLAPEWQRLQIDGLKDGVLEFFDAINASDIAWVAPWKPTPRMCAYEVYEEMRDAYLAEQAPE